MLSESNQLYQSLNLYSLLKTNNGEKLGNLIKHTKQLF